VFKGTVFELVDQAVDFVLARLHFAVGTRAASSQAPAAYEIPPEVIHEAIVNAVAHRANPTAPSPPIPCSPNPSTSPSTSNALAPARAT